MILNVDFEIGTYRTRTILFYHERLSSRSELLSNVIYDENN